jgi:hypothetical protein
MSLMVTLNVFSTNVGFTINVVATIFTLIEKKRNVSVVNTCKIKLKVSTSFLIKLV